MTIPPVMLTIAVAAVARIVSDLAECVILMARGKHVTGSMVERITDYHDDQEDTWSHVLRGHPLTSSATNPAVSISAAHWAGIAAQLANVDLGAERRELDGVDLGAERRELDGVDLGAERWELDGVDLGAERRVLDLGAERRVLDGVDLGAERRELDGGVDLSAEVRELDSGAA